MTEQSEQQIEQHEVKTRSRAAYFWLGIVILLCVCITGMVVSLQVLKLGQGNTEKLSQLQMKIDDVQSFINNTHEQSQANKKEIENLLSKQQTDLTEWQVAKAHYLVGIASDELELTQNQSTAKAALQSAQQILTKLNDPKLSAIRQAIANDITTIEATSKVNVTEIYMKLNALDQMIDDLPLPMTPLTPKAEKLDTTTSKWQQIKETLQKVVVIKQIEPHSGPLIMPEQKQFLIQNLHAQLADAMWAALHRDDQVYQASLERAITWVKTYFIVTDTHTQSFQEQLKTLRDLKLDIESQNLSATLKLFDEYEAS